MEQAQQEPRALKDRVECPYCLAPIGEPCHGATPDYAHTFPMKRGHEERVEADRAQRGKRLVRS